MLAHVNTFICLRSNFSLAIKGATACVVANNTTDERTTTNCNSSIHIVWLIVLRYNCDNSPACTPERPHKLIARRCFSRSPDLPRYPAAVAVAKNGVDQREDTAADQRVPTAPRTVGHDLRRISQEGCETEALE